MTSGVINQHVEIGLRWIGAWPGSVHSFGFYIIVFCMLLNIPSEIWHTASVYRNIEALMANICVVMAVSVAIIKIILFRLQGKNVMIVVNEVLKDWVSENELNDTEVIKKNLARGSYLTKWFIGAYNGLLMTYVVGAVTNYRQGIVEIRHYVVPSKFPEEWKQSPMYELVCLSQFIGLLCNTSSNAMIEGLLAILVLHTGTKAHIIRKEISKFTETCRSGAKREIVIQAMKKLIEKHWNFIDFVDRMETIYTKISFVHVTIYTLLHVVVAYMLLDNIEKGQTGMKLVLYTIFTTRALLSTMIYCVAGEHLMNQSEQIFKDLCASDWEEYHLIDKKAFNYIIMKARQPIYLTPAKFGQLSHNYLSAIIRTSYSFLSLARAVR